MSIVYSFATAAGLTKYVDDNDFVSMGTWSSAGTYFDSPPQSVNYGNSQYLCVTTNVGRNPSQQPTRFSPTRYWSPLVLLYEYSTGTTAPTDTALLAQAAYDLASIGTNTGTAAYTLATTGSNLAQAAFDIAVQGTNLAQLAYSLAAASGTEGVQRAYDLAVIGTNSAQAAFDIAVQGTNLAQAAFDIAVQGTNLAQIAYDLALAGTEAAQRAYDLAVVGTNIGQAAFDIAVQGTNLGQAAFDIAVAGTQRADAAFDIAVAGTNLAQAASDRAYLALTTAWVGTAIPPLASLPDVSIPAPSANQVLTFDGSLWRAQSSPASVSNAAFTYYLAEGTTFSGYETLLTSPTPGATDTDSASVTSAGSVLIRGYASGTLGRDSIDPGIWEFASYLSTTDSAQVEIQVYRYDGAAETLLISALTGTINGSVTLDTTNYFAGSFPVNPSDRIIAKYYASTWLTGPVDVNIHHSGTEHYTHIHTPLATQHNDLAGLQGGAPSERYHTTLDQQEALRGTSGYPSDANRYATGEDYRLTLALTGTNTGTAALNRANAAFDIAVSGTQTADAAFAVAVAGTNRAEQAFSLAAIGTNTGTAAFNRADAAFVIAVAGTSVGNAAMLIAASGTRTAVDAFALASVGTNTGTAAYTLATTGSNLAQSAYVMAQAGTQIPNFAAGGTMTGNLVVPNVTVGVGSYSYYSASFTGTVGTLAYSFAGPAYQRTTVNGAFAISTSSHRAGAEIAVILIPDGTIHTLAYTGSAVTWFGTTPPVQIYDKAITVAMTCITDSPVTVYGATSTQV